MNNDLIYRIDAISATKGQYPEPHYPYWYASIIEKLPAATLWKAADDPPKSDMSCIVYDGGYYYVAYYKSERYLQGFYIDGELSPTVSFWMPLFPISEDQKKIADEQEKEREKYYDRWRDNI